jgi:hypothetical protein
MSRSIRLVVKAIRELGVYPVLCYALYELQRTLGWFIFKVPIRDWKAFSLKRQSQAGIPTAPKAYRDYRFQLNRHFFFTPEEGGFSGLKQVLESKRSVLEHEAEGILKGEFSLFGKPPIPLDFPPDWNSSPVFFDAKDASLPSLNNHWSRIEIDRLPGDIKLLWELSRFRWVFVLGRAFRLSGEQKYAQAFWDLLVSWRAGNRPNQGLQWMSAQEVSLRLLALIFGHYAFFPYLKEVPSRMVTLTETIAAHAHRIPPTLLYSRSQGNNHLIVEAVGLYTAGLLFPELKNAKRWYKIGRRWFISALSDQVFPDGGYVQHSVNYQRLAIQACLWALRLGELNGEEFPEPTRGSVRKMALCLGVLLDPDTGKVPNFGSNDGALILPLTTCDFQDYRPVIQLSTEMLLGEKVYPAGPWDEAAFWFGLGSGSKVQRTEEPGGLRASERSIHGLNTTDFLSKHPKDFPQAGLYLLGGEESWGVLRCARFNSRPGHSDQLHLDLWWRGENIARDAGTYLYNGMDPWENGLATLKVHNSVIVDELEPMQRAGRFLWLDWAQGEFLGRKRTEEGEIELLSALHHGYGSLGINTARSVIRAGNHLWLVVDELTGVGVHKLRSGWLLPDAPWEMEGNSLFLDGVPEKFRIEFRAQEIQSGLYRAGELIAGEAVANCSEILGWYSPTYATKHPGLYLAASIEGELPLRLVTRWDLGDVHPEEISLEWDEAGKSPTGLKRITYGLEVLDV